MQPLYLGQLVTEYSRDRQTNQDSYLLLYNVSKTTLMKLVIILVVFLLTCRTHHINFIAFKWMIAFRVHESTARAYGALQPIRIVVINVGAHCCKGHRIMVGAHARMSVFLASEGAHSPPGNQNVLIDCRFAMLAAPVFDIVLGMNRVADPMAPLLAKRALNGLVRFRWWYDTDAFDVCKRERLIVWFVCWRKRLIIPNRREGGRGRCESRGEWALVARSKVGRTRSYAYWARSECASSTWRSDLETCS
jgi:hypothetical protein